MGSLGIPDFRAVLDDVKDEPLLRSGAPRPAAVPHP
jgi:hypothetical protein